MQGQKKRNTGKKPFDNPPFLRAWAIVVRSTAGMEVERISRGGLLIIETRGIPLKAGSEEEKGRASAPQPRPVSFPTGLPPARGTMSFLE